MALEYRDGEDLVIEAQLPDIDPDREIDVWIAQDILHIRASRTGGHEPSDHASDVRYGVFARDIALPAGVTEDHVSASYADGRLVVRAPVGDPVHVVRIRIPVVHEGLSIGPVGALRP